MKTKEEIALKDTLKIIDNLQKENRGLKTRLQMIKDQYLLGFIQFDNEDDISLLEIPNLL
jgi:hypothetical protein